MRKEENQLHPARTVKPPVSPSSAALAVLAGGRPRHERDDFARRIGQARTLALACLSGCVAAGIVACSGTATVASSPAPAAKVTVTRNPGTPGASAPSTARSEKAAAAVAANYYRAIAAQNYRLAFTYLAANATGPDGRRLTLQAFLQLAHMLDGQGGPVTSFSAAAFHSMVVMTIYRKKFGPYHAHLQMALDKGGWAIVSIDRT